MMSQGAIDMTRLEPFDEYLEDPAIGVTSLTYKLDEGYSYIITGLKVRLKASPNPGNRQFKLTFRDSGNNNISEHRTNHNQVAGETVDYFFNLNGPEVATPDGITNQVVYARVPFNVMNGGDSVQVNVLTPIGVLDIVSQFNIRGLRCKVDTGITGIAG